MIEEREYDKDLGTLQDEHPNQGLVFKISCKDKEERADRRSENKQKEIILHTARNCITELIATG